MDIAGLFVFAAALFVAAASPGPAITALVARVLVRGTSGAVAFMLGLSIGDIAWLTAAVLGLAFIAKTFALAFLVVKYLGAAYLLYLAWRMWTASGERHEVEEPKAERPLRLFLTGLSLTLGNPKTIDHRRRLRRARGRDARRLYDRRWRLHHPRGARPQAFQERPGDAFRQPRRRRPDGRRGRRHSHALIACSYWLFCSAQLRREGFFPPGKYLSISVSSPHRNSSDSYDDLPRRRRRSRLSRA
jgi:hypothetical protein